jgi:twitching motility protein PilT
VNSAISNLVREGKTFQIPSLMQTGRGVGMRTMNDALLELVTQRLVDPAEAYAKAISKEEFRGMLERGGFRVGTTPEARQALAGAAAGG